MNQPDFNYRLRQILVLIFIILMAVLLINQLSVFIPGLLGGITLYILSRSLYLKLIYKYKWKKGLTAIAFIIIYIAILALPFYFSITLISPKINELLNNQDRIVKSLQEISSVIQDKTGFTLLTSENIKQLASKGTALVPKLLNSTAIVLANMLMMFFLLYYLLVDGRTAEKNLQRIIPLASHNINELSGETKMMVKANALGIPIISFIQGLVAALGYFIFNVDGWGMWGFVTGVFAFFPLVGTMIVWVPLTIYLYAQGHVWPSVGLAIYSIIVTGNIDYVARLNLMKKMGDVHPLITVLGVIVGLKLFGFIGLVFGPLLISYFILMVKIYSNEFGGEKINNEGLAASKEIKSTTKEE